MKKTIFIIVLVGILLTLTNFSFAHDNDVPKIFSISYDQTCK